MHERFAGSASSNLSSIGGGSVPNGPLTPALSTPGPTRAPVYGPATHRYGEAPPATYGSPAPVSRPVEQRDHAQWARRVPGFLLDFAPAILAIVPLAVAYVMFLAAVLRVPTGTESLLGDLSGIVAWIAVGGILAVAALGWVIYNRWLIAGRTGQSLGKRISGLRLIGDETAEPIGSLNAFTRDLVHILDLVVLIGFLWPLWDDKRQTFADMLMQTVVTDERGASVSSSSAQGRAT